MKVGFGCPYGLDALLAVMVSGAGVMLAVVVAVVGER